MSTSESNLQQEVKSAVAVEFSSRQTSLLQEVKNSIADALKSEQRVVVITDQIKEEKKCRWCDFMQVVIPALLTSVFGLIILYTQHNLSRELSSTSARYFLTQEFGKEQFKAYQRILERLRALEDALAGGTNVGSTAKSEAVSAYNSLNDERSKSEFYFSQDVHDDLEGVASLASETKTINPQAPEQSKDVIAKISSVRKKIRAEVSGEMGLLPAQK